MFLFYVLSLTTIVYICEKTKAEDIGNYIFIAMAFMSTVFIFRDFQFPNMLTLVNVKASVILLIIQGIYLLINVKNNNHKWYETIPIILLLLKNPHVQALVILSILSFSSLKIMENKIKFKWSHGIVVILLVFNFLGKTHWMIEVIFMALICLSVFENLKKLEQLLLFSTFTMLHFSFTSMKFISLLLLTLVSLKYYVLPEQYSLLKQKLLSSKLLIKYQTKILLCLKERTILKSPLKEISSKNVNFYNLSGLTYNIELFIIVIIFVFMVIL